MPDRNQMWLVKSEPDTYSIDDLERDKRAAWDGVRNYQARNLLRDRLKRGDGVLFYHSSADPIGVAGLARVSREGFPDATAWDKKSEYFDSRSTVERPVWYAVELEFIEKFPRLVPLSEIKQDPVLKGMMVARRGARLSVQPVEPAHFNRVLELAGSLSKRSSKKDLASL